MVAIELDPAKEQQLRHLAQSCGEDIQVVARRIVEDYLDFVSLSADSAEDWAEASVKLAAEIESDKWDEETGGRE